jgi:uncharacterized membrane protein
VNLRRYFFTGLVVVLPTVVTFYLLYVIGEKLDNVLGGVFRGEWIRPGGIPGLGLVSLVLIILLIGIITSKTLGRRLVDFWERVLARIPILNRMYVASKQIAEAVFRHESVVFRRVVLVEFPRKGLYALAFRTQEAPAEIQRRTDANLIAVFLPTTPNPTSGYLILVPEEEIIDLDMNVEQGLKVVISAGSVSTPEIVVPPAAGGPAKPAPDRT